MALFKANYNDDTYDGQGAERSGALLEVIRHNWEEGEMSWKYPHSEIHKGNHLIVNDMQAVLFYSSGELCDVFNPDGGHGQNVTLDVRNIPLLSRLINKPWGESPWPCDIFFVNLVPFREMFWGTPNPVKILDRSMGAYPIPIPVSCAVQYGVRIVDPTKFMKKIVGTKEIVTTEEVSDRFDGVISNKFPVVTTELMKKDNLSVFDLQNLLEPLAEAMSEALQGEMAQYGMKVENFHVRGFEPDDADPNVARIMEARAKRSGFDAMGEYYRAERQFDIMEKAAANEGAAGQVMGAGMGMGMGFGMGGAFGAQMGNIAGNTMQPTPPPMPNAVMFHVYLNGAQVGPYNIQQLQQYIQMGQITRDTLVWTNGMPQWAPAGTCPQLMNLFGATPPPVPPMPPMP